MAPSPGRSNSSFHPLTALALPLLMVKLAPQPVPQSEVTEKVAVTEPAPSALVTGTMAAASATAAAAMRPLRTDRFIASPGVIN
jgi:hypothetical protein